MIGSVTFVVNILNDFSTPLKFCKIRVTLSVRVLQSNPEFCIRARSELRLKLPGTSFLTVQLYVML